MPSQQQMTKKCRTCRHDKPLKGGRFDKPPQYGGQLICADCTHLPENVSVRAFPVPEHFTTPVKD